MSWSLQPHHQTRILILDASAKPQIMFSDIIFLSLAHYNICTGQLWWLKLGKHCCYWFQVCDGMQNPDSCIKVKTPHPHFQLHCFERCHWTDIMSWEVKWSNMNVIPRDTGPQLQLCMPRQHNSCVSLFPSTRSASVAAKLKSRLVISFCCQNHWQCVSF